jgi:hypothetical protein
MFPFLRELPAALHTDFDRVVHEVAHGSNAIAQLSYGKGPQMKNEVTAR